MANRAPKDLVVIGTARKPNSRDLRIRGLTGLQDEDASVALLRAVLQSGQSALRAHVSLPRSEDPESYLRTKIPGADSDKCTTNISISGGEMKASEASSEAMDEDGTDIGGSTGSGDGRKAFPRSTAQVDRLDLAVSAAGTNDEACGSQQATRQLRDRKPIQLRPYALEREVYCRKVKAGRRGE